MCRSCGMCCDNTMFGRVIVTQWEAVKLRARGIDVTTYDDGERSFAQPCPRLSGDGCGIYKSRPHTCRSYVCETINALRAGHIDAGAAQDRIDRTLAARAALVPQAGDEDLFEYRNRVTDALEEGEPASAIPACTPELVRLETLLNRWFRTDDYAKRVPDED
nr:YkgJ family cysteine cluster protein [Altererythrobacter sp. KTW20L]